MKKKNEKSKIDSPQSMGNKFEMKIFDFVKLLGLKDVGHRIKFGQSDEVDVVAGW